MEKMSELMFVLGQGIASPHSVRFIIGIHQGFLPFPVGDSLFKDTSDGSALTAIIGIQSRPLPSANVSCHQYNDCIRSDPKDEKHPLGIDLKCQRNQPLI